MQCTNINSKEVLLSLQCHHSSTYCSSTATAAAATIAVPMTNVRTAPASCAISPYFCSIVTTIIIISGSRSRSTSCPYSSINWTSTTASASALTQPVPDPTPLPELPLMCFCVLGDTATPVRDRSAQSSVETSVLHGGTLLDHGKGVLP
ncbi:uncharacterized protein LOC126457108 isoform X2 [Schistocerca serialis cubense]|uniref:uncharacterized protein LOC126457108 isoform X2 n=1 Tax=Schistocerca serialis cubense TaxID=2023355 RepID=UPI00214E58EE|nr:uncharacterized protein LOC126457108 isoform X2 [Schistocerca serialis cubense]